MSLPVAFLSSLQHQDAVSSAVVIDGFMKMVREEFPISQISEEDVLIDVSST